MTYTPIFQSNTALNNDLSQTPVNLSATIIPTFVTGNGNILEDLLRPLPTTYTSSHQTLTTADGALVLDPTSFDPKYDSASNYTLKLVAPAVATVTVTEVTNQKTGANFDGFTTQSGVERIDYAATSGDKLVVAHNYSINTVLDANKVNVLSSVKVDATSSTFIGANNVASVLNVVNKQTQNLVSGNLVTVNALSEAKSTHSATVFTNYNHSLVTTSDNDPNANAAANQTILTPKTSNEVHALNHVNVDTNPAVAYSLSHTETDYNASATSHIQTNKLNFRDSTIAIAVTQVKDVIKTTAGTAGDISGNLVVISDNFALNTKLSTDFRPNFFPNNIDPQNAPDTQKATLDSLFLTGGTVAAGNPLVGTPLTTSFQGTVDADTISIRSNAKNLTVDGLVGNDTIYGWIQNDTIVGGDGSDVITGRQGADTMTGGKAGDASGADIIKDKFVIGNFDSGITVATADRITDFTTGIPAVTGTPGTPFAPADSLALGVAGTVKNFAPLQTAATFQTAFTSAGLALTALKVAGENGEKFAYVVDSVTNDGYLFDDVNGDGVADQVIILTGAPVLDFADIVA